MEIWPRRDRRPKTRPTFAAISGAQLNWRLSQTQLANIALEEGHDAESEGLIRTAATEFEKEKLLDNQAVAQVAPDL